MALSTKRHAHVTRHLGVSILWIFAQSQVELYVITQLVVYGVRGSSRDVDCSTGQRPMEWADEPPPLVLLYQVGFGWVPGMRCQKVVV